MSERLATSLATESGADAGTALLRFPWYERQRRRDVHRDGADKRQPHYRGAEMKATPSACSRRGELIYAACKGHTLPQVWQLVSFW